MSPVRLPSQGERPADASIESASLSGGAAPQAVRSRAAAPAREAMPHAAGSHGASAPREARSEPGNISRKDAMPPEKAPSAGHDASDAPAGAAASPKAADAPPVAGEGAPANAWRQTLRRLVPGLGAAASFSAVISLLMLTGSIYMLQVYDRVLSSGSVSTLLGLFFIVIALYAFLGFYDSLRARILSRAAIRLDQGIGAETFRAWLRSGLPGGGADAAGGTQPLHDLEAVRGFLAGPAVIALFDLPWAPIFIAVLFMIHPWIGWATVGGVAVVALLAVVNRMVTRASMQRAASLDGAERDFHERGRRSAEAIVAMGMEHAVTLRWRGLHDMVLAGNQAGGDPSGTLFSMSRAFRMLLQSAILTLGAWLVLRDEITAGMIIASSILSGRALVPVDQVIGHWRTIGRAHEAHKRLTAFFAALPAVRPRIDLPDPTGRIAVSGLTKRAPGRKEDDHAPILDGLSFALEPGDGLGVIGASAAGKSTLARLLVGAWTPDAGEVRLDGATPDQWDPVRLGRRIGYLPQVLDMLPGTIRDNIARFDAEASDEAVIEAATLAGIHDMVLRLPDGYATRLGGTGGDLPLSGGQLQRVGLARAIYGKPALVVLDEPNSNLDIAGDAALTRAITALRSAGSAVVVMAHRPSALAAVNKIMILREGRMVDFGDKERVLAAALGRRKEQDRKGATPPVAARNAARAADAPGVAEASRAGVVARLRTPSAGTRPGRAVPMGAGQ